MNTPRRLLPLGFLMLVVGACSAAAPSASPSPEPSPSAPPASSEPGGGQPGNTGSGAILPPDFPVTFPGVPGDPAPGEPTIVQPRAGLLDVHPVGVTRIDALVDGRQVVVRLTWYSGVEECHALAGVDVDKSGTAITLTVNEGTPNRDAVCIELAMLKAVVVDLGELEPGSYTISAGGQGDAQPVTVTVS